MKSDLDFPVQPIWTPLDLKKCVKMNITAVWETSEKNIRNSALLWSSKNLKGIEGKENCKFNLCPIILAVFLLFSYLRFPCSYQLWLLIYSALYSIFQPFLSFWRAHKGTIYRSVLARSCIYVQEAPLFRGLAAQNRCLTASKCWDPFSKHCCLLPLLRAFKNAYVQWS